MVCSLAGQLRARRQTQVRQVLLRIEMRLRVAVVDVKQMPVQERIHVWSLVSDVITCVSRRHFS